MGRRRWISKYVTWILKNILVLSLAGNLSISATIKLFTQNIPKQISISRRYIQNVVNYVLFPVRFL
jgi:hypothetical protein